jgi:hypothetical protein
MHYTNRVPLSKATGFFPVFLCFETEGEKRKLKELCG